MNLEVGLVGLEVGLVGLEVGLEVNPLAASEFFFLASYWPASILPAPDKYAILINKVASYHTTSPKCACQLSKAASVAYNPGNRTHKHRHEKKSKQTNSNPGYGSLKYTSSVRLLVSKPCLQLSCADL